MWRNICFNRSSFSTLLYHQNQQRVQLHRSPTTTIPRQVDPPVRHLFQRLTAIARSTTNVEGHGQSPKGKFQADNALPLDSATSRRAWNLASWDPSYPQERVDWYGEYIARHAPLSISWLQKPEKVSNEWGEAWEAKGIGYHTGSRGSQVVAPLGDGSVCLWELTHNNSSLELPGVRRGANIARSKSGLLSGSGSGGNPGPYTEHPVECVSIDSIRNKAYFAVYHTLKEVDLETLQISSCEPYNSAISALSKVDYPVPLTVGTTDHLYLHDPRRAKNSSSSTSDQGNRVENVAAYPAPPPTLQHHFSRSPTLPSPSYHASLSQPGPQSILHLASSGSNNPSDSEIYIGGRFPSILIYDRRCFPKLQNTIHSGARLCSLASLPYSFIPRETDLMQRNNLSPTQILDLKSQPGSTLIACGEYNGKGSLEIYGLSPASNTRVSTSPTIPPFPTPVFKNRVNASRSKLLSVATHGTRLVISDSDGQLKWMERDGSTLVRRCDINTYDNGYRGFGFSFGSDQSLATDDNREDVIRKIIPTNENISSGCVARDELLVWTGEKIGLLGFRSKSAFGIEDWEEKAKSVEERTRTREENVYQRTMRRVLEKQADEVRFLPGLGLGR